MQRTYVGELARQLVVQSLIQSSEKRATSGEYDVAHEHLTHIGIAGVQGLTNEVRKGTRDIGICGLVDSDDETGAHGKREVRHDCTEKTRNPRCGEYVPNHEDE